MKDRPRGRSGAPFPLRQQLIKVAKLLQKRRKRGVVPPGVDDLDNMAPGKARQHVVEGMPSLGRMELDYHVHLLESRCELRVKEFPLSPFDVAPHQYFCCTRVFWMSVLRYLASSRRALLRPTSLGGIRLSRASSWVWICWCMFIDHAIPSAFKIGSCFSAKVVA